MRDSEVNELLGEDGDESPPTRGVLRLEESEAIARRQVLNRLLMHGADRDQIVETMTARFGMTPASTHALMRAVMTEWVEEEKERRPVSKRAQVKRLHRHILKASDQKSWNAVAQLEKVLMLVEGNAEPLEMNLTGEIQMNESITAIIGEMKPGDLKELIHEEREALITEGVDVPVEGPR